MLILLSGKGSKLRLERMLMLSNALEMTAQYIMQQPVQQNIPKLVEKATIYLKLYISSIEKSN